MDIGQIFDNLQNVNSVQARNRYFAGGRAAFRSAFATNDAERVRRLIHHLIEGPGDRFARMADCIFNRVYQIGNLSRSGVQELYGWLNDDGTPIRNSRTERALRWLGFDVEVHEPG